MRVTLPQVFLLRDSLVAYRKELFKTLMIYENSKGESQLLEHVKANLQSIKEMHNILADESKILRAAAKG